MQSLERKTSFSSFAVISLSLVVGLVTFGVFYQVRSFEFLNFDDDLYIFNNPHVSSGLSIDNLIWALTASHGGHWHPIAWISHMIDCELFGLEPGIHHLESVIFHALTSVLVFLFFLRVSKILFCSFILALIFAIHPLRIESVVWLSERKDVLSLFFGMLAVHGYLSFQARRTFSWYGATLLMFTLGLLAKPSLVVMPVLFILLDYWPGGSVRRKVFLIGEKLPFFLLALATGVLAILSQQAGGGLKQLSSYTLSERLASSFVGYLAYFGKLFFPTGMGIFYPFESYAPGIASGAAVSLLFITWSTFHARSKHPYIWFGWLWFLISAAPIIGIIQVGGQAFADRWTYLPHVGLTLGVGLTFYRYFKIEDSIWKKGCLMIIPMVFAFVTSSQLLNWRNTETVFRHLLELSPNNFMAYTNLGVEFDRKGDLKEAEQYFQRAVELRPRYTLALDNLGSIYARTGRYQEAKKLFERALQVNPMLESARYHLGLVNSRMGDQLKAITEWISVLERHPGDERTLKTLQEVSAGLRGKGCAELSILGLNKRTVTEFQSALLSWKPKQDEEVEVHQTLLSVSGCFGPQQ